MEEALPTTRIPPLQDFFTASEVAAAEQLVQLSESSGDSFPRRTLSSSSFASSSSPRSVNTRPPATAMVAEADEDDDEEQHEFGGAPRLRRRPRYRLIADLYAASALIDDETGGAEKRINGEERRSRQKRSRGGK
ncbi:uncharacterized protein LOC120104443 [Phoenix dactylifera]|uniref:Uncharacterized protein LOC120104443 n=1 Tax=Phoenix dactylifera TaxID=42345 RepID=A0A8B8ZBU3_PHODC|nr:uncharacterized protein LOC120104443 [Phoenix dactylifera]